MKYKLALNPCGFSLTLFLLILIAVAFQARFGNADKTDEKKAVDPKTFMEEYDTRPEDEEANKQVVKDAEEGGSDSDEEAPAKPKDKDKKKESKASNQNEDDDHGSTRNRKFDKNCCRYKIRTSFVTDDICGKAALCYWEIWNYRTLRNKALKIDYDGKCDEYMVQKYICLIGYPKPYKPNAACEPALQECDRILSRMLYEDCEPLRQKRGLLRPQDVHHHIRTKDMNFDLSDNPDKYFQPLPNSEAPTHNNFYAISCPIIYRYPYFTINLLLKDLNPQIEYDETNALEGVGAMLPQYARVGIDNERKVNFEALSLTDEMINWCGVPRNYICVRKSEVDRDPLGDKCLWETLDKLRVECEPDVPMPLPVETPFLPQTLQI